MLGLAAAFSANCLQPNIKIKNFTFTSLVSQPPYALNYKNFRNPPFLLQHHIPTSLFLLYGKNTKFSQKTQKSNITTAKRILFHYKHPSNQVKTLYQDNKPFKEKSFFKKIFSVPRKEKTKNGARAKPHEKQRNEFLML